MKTKTSHTPGPWVIQTLTDRFHGYDWSTFAIRSTPQNYCLAVIGDIDRATAPQNEANARLIAATPELLACLRELEAVATKFLAGGYNHQMEKAHRLLGEYSEQARAAILKATGGEGGR